MNTITKHELFMSQAPNFNFEYDADQLLELALERGFLKPTHIDDVYEINENYGE